MKRDLLRACALAGLLLVLPARATEAPGAGNASQTAPGNGAPVDPKEAAWDNARAAMLKGPVDVPLVDQAILHLPEHFVFVPREQATALMAEMGNRTSDDFIGLIFPFDDKEQWFASLRYVGEGYIKDDEAKNWDAAKLLDNLKEGTEQGNDFRKQKGVPPIEITGWVQAPAYDAAAHRLVWSAGIKEKGAPASADDGVNYNTYVLGREGYISLDFITSQNTIEAEKPTAQELLAEVDFKPGRRYTDFTSSTDKVAAYGIAALIGGVALKKLGLFALGAAFVAKFAKVIAIAFLAFVRPLYRRFKRGG